MSTYDLILRNADIATAGDRYTADIGVRDGRICAIAPARRHLARLAPSRSLSGCAAFLIGLRAP